MDSYLIQLDLDNLSDWSKLSDLSFNQNKFVHIHFGKTGTTSHDYFINGNKITTQESTKDLGIILSNNLDWSEHYHSITAKAYKILGLLRRCFKTNSIDAKRKLYISLVRSHLLYCSQIWRPHKIKDILLLERVQRRATKYILDDYTSSYKSRLTKLNLLPLMYIYELHDLIFYIKSYKNPSSYFNINHFIFCSSISTRSSSGFKLQHTGSSTNLTHNFYFCRLPRLWNSLPTIDISLSVSAIKHKLQLFLWNHFTNNFEDNNSCSLHYYCPCSGCSHRPRPPNRTVL